MKFLKDMYISLSESLGIYTVEQYQELLTARQHATPVSYHRATIMQSRIYFFCVVFAILVPAWSVIDYIFLPDALWNNLIMIRIITAAVFAAIAWQARKEPSLIQARLLLAAMLAVTPVFHLLSDYWIQGYQLDHSAQIIGQLYALLPFVMVAGLTLFPLTLMEFFSYAIPMFVVTLYTTLIDSDTPIAHTISSIWLFVLILGVALFSSLTQLRYMLSQVSQASYDALTGLLTRRAGIEMLDLQYRLATMNDLPLAVLFCDLDNFKHINDTYGHDAGDQVLKKAAKRIRSATRKGDSVIRWGGEEFIVILPTAKPKAVNDVVRRIMAKGIGKKPDGDLVTASIGIAEVQNDHLKDWKSQVELADVRMYSAKTAGRARCISSDGEIILWHDHVNKDKEDSLEINTKTE